MIREAMTGAMTGAAAGAAGTTALNAVTYTDMVLTGRGGSSAPKDVVDRMSGLADVAVPGSGEERENRATGLGALLGMGAGVGVGALYGLVRAAGWRPPLPLAAVLTGAAAMAGSDAPLAALKVSDPRGWQASDWVRDVLPHLAYGLVTAAVHEAAAGRGGLGRDGRRR